MPSTRRRRIRLTSQLVAVVAVAVVSLGACGANKLSDQGGGGSQVDATDYRCYDGHQGCPCAHAGATADCGSVVHNYGSYIECSEGKSTCSGGTWGACLGNTIVDMSVGGSTLGPGGIKPLGTSSMCADPCDPNSCTQTTDGPPDLPPDAAGLLVTEAGIQINPTIGNDGGMCTGLQCNVPVCTGGKTTTITGTVYDPAAINPVYNAVVMIPASAAAIQPVPAGVSSDPCGGATLPPAVTFGYTDTKGNFTLTGVPVAASVPLVIQIGRWRRIATINTASLTCGASINVSTGCSGVGHYSTTTNCATRLPRVQSEGNIPHIAIATGGLDAIECMLYRMGVSSTEFTDELHTGRIHMFDDGGADLASPAASHDVSYLLGFGCPGSQCPASTASASGITNSSFETGTTTGWTATGTGSASNATAINGSWSAIVGSSAKTKVVSTLSQTFTAPAGATGLTFYALPECSTSSGSTGFTANLVDNTAGYTQSWSSICDTNTWYLYSAYGLYGGHSYTLNLVNTNNKTNATMYTYVDYVNWAVSPASLLPNYDMVMLPCDGGNEYGSSNWGGSYDDPGRSNLVSYASVGGRIFTSHWGREWIERQSGEIANGPFPGVATWITDDEPCNLCTTSATGLINSGSAWGTPFNAWMTNVGAAASSKFTIDPWRYDTSSVSAASRLFVSYLSNSDPADFTFDTPLGGTAVGRVMFTDMHLANGTPSGTFPGNCPTQGSALLDQEDAAEYLIFDLGACVSGLPIPGPVTQDNPASFTVDFTSTCPSGTHADWRELDWQATIPATSSIVFSAQTADPTADGGVPSYAGVQSVQLADATTTTPNLPTGWNAALIDVVTDAGTKGAFNTASPIVTSKGDLRLTIGLNPTTDLKSSPTLINWRVIYDCPPSE